MVGRVLEQRLEGQRPQPLDLCEVPVGADEHGVQCLRAAATQGLGQLPLHLDAGRRVVLALFVVTDIRLPRVSDPCPATGVGKTRGSPLDPSQGSACAEHPTIIPPEAGPRDHSEPRSSAHGVLQHS